MDTTTSDDDDPRPDDDAPRAERAAWNRREHARQTAARAAEAKAAREAGGASDRAPPSDLLARAHAAAGKGWRSRVRAGVKATVLAVLDPASPADIGQRLEAARLGATIGGLMKPAAVVVPVGFAVAFGAMGGSVPGEDAPEPD